MLLAPVALFWLFCILGALDFDIIDLDLDADGGSDSGDGFSLFGGITRWLVSFVHGDAVPIAVLLSLLVVYQWGGVMLGNHFWDIEGSFFLAALIAAIVFIPATLLTRYTGQLLIPVFRVLHGDEGEAEPVIGRRGRVRSRVLDSKSGQVEVEDPEVPLLINARLADFAQPLLRGDSVIVEKYEKESGTYLVTEDLNPQE